MPMSRTGELSRPQRRDKMMTEAKPMRMIHKIHVCFVSHIAAAALAVSGCSSGTKQSSELEWQATLTMIRDSLTQIDKGDDARAMAYSREQYSRVLRVMEMASDRRLPAPEIMIAYCTPTNQSMKVFTLYVTWIEQGFETFGVELRDTSGVIAKFEEIHWDTDSRKWTSGLRRDHVIGLTSESNLGPDGQAGIPEGIPRIQLRTQHSTLQEPLYVSLLYGKSGAKSVSVPVFVDHFREEPSVKK